jgi:hypothetical protein
MRGVRATSSPGGPPSQKRGSTGVVDRGIQISEVRTARRRRKVTLSKRA